MTNPPPEARRTEPDRVSSQLLLRVMESMRQSSPLSRMDAEKVADSRARRWIRWILAAWTLLVLTGQMCLLSYEFHLMGACRAHFTEYTFHTFVAATVIQAWGIVLILARWVFKD